MANEILKFLNGQSSNLASKTVKAGQVYFAINSDGETGSIYFDAPISSTVTKRIAMSGQSVEHANEADYATRDALGNIITDTYISQMRLDNSGTKIQYKYPGTQTWSELQPLFLPLAGGQITNDLGVNGTITAGNLIVNGAARFAQTILGNILSADKWSTARNFAISDASAAHTGTTVPVDGSAAVTIPLPATITASIIGHASEDLALSGGTMTGDINLNNHYLKGENSSTNHAIFPGASGQDHQDFYEYGGVWNFYQSRSGTNTLLAKIDSTGIHANADSASIWKTGRKFSISDHDASHTGTQVSVDGSQDYVLPLPSTIKGTLEGNATTSTTTSKLAVGASITTAENLDAFLEASKLKATLISTGVTYSNGTLSANDGEVISIGYSNTTYGNQIFFDPDTDKISVRRKSTSWKPWVDLIHTGNISSYNAGSSSKWATARKFSISDSDASNTGTQVSVDGSKDYVLPLPATIKATLKGNADTATNAAYQHYYYHDLFAFCRIGTPTLETTTDGTTWVAATLNKNIFDQQDLTSMTLFDNNIIGYRWIWHSNNFSYSGGAFILTSWSYTSPSSTQSVTLETSTDGTTWTSRGTMTGNWSSSNGTLQVNGYGSDSWIKVTILRTSTSGTTRLANLRLLSARPGDQGQGKEYEYPYTWDANSNIFPVVNNTQNLGSSSLKWAHIYGDLVGNADSATEWKDARNFAVADNDASHTGEAVSVNGTSNVTLKLPSTIKASLAGNATTATTATNATNLLAYAGNEVTIGANSATAGVSTNNAVYINYRDISNGAKDNNATQITDYYFCNRKGGTAGVTVRAETFSGNATSASKWKDVRNFYIADADAANTGTAVSVDGSANVTLKLPSTIKATLMGNASSATKAYVTIADTTKFYLIGSTNTSSGNADLKEDTGLYAGTTKGQLGAAYIGINGDNTSYRLYVNGTSLFTDLVNINTSTGTLKIGSQNSSWTHFEAQRDFYFNRQASINGNFLPYIDLTYNLGADSYRWSNIYANVLRLQGAASDPSTSAGARIEFTYDNNTSRSQGVYISYSPNDSYRAPGGLKVMGASDLGGSAWFEVEGATYSNGIIYAKASTDSSSTSTGALVVTGGVGIAKQLRVGGNTNIAGTLGVTNATTLSSTLTVSGNTSLNGNLTVASNKTTTLGGTLTVSGIATFSNQIKVEKDTDSIRSLDGNASIVTDGGVSVAKQLSAKMIKIDNGQPSEGCQLIYNETNNCLEFVFS